MEDKKDISIGSKSKKKSYIKLCPEKWIFGSTREEMTNAERAVWMDFLTLAAINDPIGYIDFISYKGLANKLNISQKLLKSTINKALTYGKIEIKETQVGSDLNEKTEKNNLTCDQPEPKTVNLVTTQSKTGLTLRTMKIRKWNEYQSEYMRQKPYRKKDGDKDDENGELQNPGPKVVTQVTDKGEERRIEENRREENKKTHPKTNPSNSPLPSTPTKKEEFLLALKKCKGYPFNETKDSLLFDVTMTEQPEINILRQIKRKVEWWGLHPDALKTNPRKQLEKFFKEEEKFQKRGGPQQVGNIMKELEDPDHRAWLKNGFLEDPIKKEDQC